MKLLADMLVIALAKVVGLAVVVWLYAPTPPALMRLSWFARWHVH